MSRVKIHLCDIRSNEKLKIKVVRKHGRCNYHVVGDTYLCWELSCESLCAEAYHNAYLFCLGLLFGASFHEKESRKDSLILKCPAVKNFVVMEIQKVPLPFKLKLLNILKKMVHPLYPAAIFNCGIRIKILETKGKCLNGHIVGDTFEFNLGNFQLTSKYVLNIGYPRELCPAAFDNLYPYLGYVRWEGKLPWTPEAEINRIGCPDHKASVEFQIKK